MCVRCDSDDPVFNITYYVNPPGLYFTANHNHILKTDKARHCDPILILLGEYLSKFTLSNPSFLGTSLIPPPPGPEILTTVKALYPHIPWGVLPELVGGYWPENYPPVSSGSPHYLRELMCFQARARASQEGQSPSPEKLNR